MENVLVIGKRDRRIKALEHLLAPHARVLCLADQITLETERAVRNSGFLYLGSYDHFFRAHKDILKSALKWNYY